MPEGSGYLFGSYRERNELRAFPISDRGVAIFRDRPTFYRATRSSHTSAAVARDELLNGVGLCGNSCLGLVWCARIRNRAAPTQNFARTSRDARDASRKSYMRDGEGRVETQRRCSRWAGPFPEELPCGIVAPAPKLTSPHEASVVVADRDLLRIVKHGALSAGKDTKRRRMTVDLANACLAEHELSTVTRFTNFRGDPILREPSWPRRIGWHLRQPRSAPTPHRSVPHEGAASFLPERQHACATSGRRRRGGVAWFWIALVEPAKWHVVGRYAHRAEERREKNAHREARAERQVRAFGICYRALIVRSWDYVFI